jgi:16S rRNA (cytosine1402-N4)-methyltransferase
MNEHIPVLFKEGMEALMVKTNAWYIDATFGRGGHTKGILDRGGKVIALDHDQEAIDKGKTVFSQEIQDGKLELVRSNFDAIESIDAVKNKAIDGVLFDFGVNSAQLDSAVRGFSFQLDAPLDMRMDDRLGVTARDLVNALGKKELFALLTTYAQESRARFIVDAILVERSKRPIETTQQLAQLVERAVGGRKKHERLHPATKTFMALRMAVNDELGNIERVLPAALNILQVKGKLVTIAFHEGEDRLVKHAMRAWEEQGKGFQLTKHPIEPSEEELRRNPRSRSAKLRVFEKGL